MKVEQIRERVTSFIILSVTECPNAAMMATTCCLLRDVRLVADCRFFGSIAQPA
jgi:hypothetical protein